MCPSNVYLFISAVYRLEYKYYFYFDKWKDTNFVEFFVVIVVVAAVKKQYYSHNGKIIAMLFLSYKEHKYVKSMTLSLP